MLTFDAEAHQYFWNGRPVPNVTRIIAPLSDYSRIPPDVLEKARQEGNAIHSMIDMDCKGVLDSVPEWMLGHRRAWDRFKEETGLECWVSEHKMFHPRLHYAGTSDLIGMLPKIKTVNGPAVVDAKRSLYAGPAIGLQTAAYRKQWNDTEGKNLRIPEQNRFALQLGGNGQYRLTRFDQPDDETAFIACLHQLRWRERNYPNQEA